MRSAVECWGLTKNYRGLLALDGLSLKIEPGEFFGLLGPNGAGKSTFIKIMVGLVRQSSGWAQVGNAPAGGVRAKETFGYLPELFRFPPWMSGRELLHMHGRLIGLERAEIKRRSDEVLELTGMAQAAERRISGYSKGMQQRIGLAQAILGRPPILFLDEPTSALDPVGRVHVRNLLSKLASEGTTILLNSHLLTDVERVCARIAVINHGRVVKMGRPSDLTSGGPLVLRLDSHDEALIDALTERFGRTEPGPSDGEIRIFNDDEEAAPEIAAFISRHDRRLYELHRESGSLEDVFLELLGGDSDE